MEETHKLHGRAFRAGEPVCGDLEITLRWEERVGPLPLEVSNREVLRDRSLRGPATVRFSTRISRELQRELAALATAARDPNEGRRQRDAQWAPKPVDIVLDTGYDLAGCRISRPVEPMGAMSELEFGLHHEDL